jgi:hypothetical protein
LCILHDASPAPPRRPPRMAGGSATPGRFGLLPSRDIRTSLYSRAVAESALGARGGCGDDGCVCQGGCGFVAQIFLTRHDCT